ncbi:hypothetical protein ABZ922_22570 [Streptomyces shenzhenensis]|uniref:hypothetical protein n=1 Tax=Streptomyces shenzhenensis TaxID=943815 RepID=UPI0033E19A02
MSLVNLIAQADERGLTASGLACLDRCVPLLGGDDEALRPLWGSLADGGGDWRASLEKARAALRPQDPGEDEAARLAHRMLDAAPAERTGAAVRVWADACSVAALRVHRLLEPAEGGTGTDDAALALRPRPLAAVRAGRPTGERRTEGMSPLVAAELRRQVTVLELLAERGAGGLRRALDVTTEGRRVLAAVVSRRARGRA